MRFAASLPDGQHERKEKHFIPHGMRNFCRSRLLENLLWAFVRRHLPYVIERDCGFCADADVSAEEVNCAKLF
jgi:hypothetical protein